MDPIHQESVFGIRTILHAPTHSRFRLLPRPLAALGITGATLVFVYALLVMFGAAVQGATPLVILALPIAVYEMILAVWLIVKGFNSSAIASQATTSTKLVAEPLVP